MDNKETYIRDNILDALRVVLPWLLPRGILASAVLNTIAERFVLDGGKAIGPNVTLASVYRDSGVHFRHYLIQYISVVERILFTIFYYTGDIMKIKPIPWVILLAVADSKIRHHPCVINFL